MKYFFMLFVCLTLSHFGYTQNDDRGYIVKVGDKAPDITITYTDGTRKKLSDFRGKSSCYNLQPVGAEYAVKKCLSSKKTFG